MSTPAHNAHLLQMDRVDRMHKAVRLSGLNVQEIAARLDVSRNTVSNWLNGHTEPRRRDLAAFALLTGVPAEWLRTGQTPDFPGGNRASMTMTANPMSASTEVHRLAA